MKLTDAEVYDLVVPWRGMCPFVEDVSDGSMCECGLPALGHDDAVIRLARRYQQDYFAAIERIVAARLEQQREALAAAIEQEACGCCDANPDGDCTEAEMRICERTLADAARIVREYQPGEDT